MIRSTKALINFEEEEEVFVDANVLLEAFLSDRKNRSKARQYLSLHNTVISPLSAHLFVHFGMKAGLNLDILLNILSQYKYTDLGTHELMWAIQNHQDSDFEDAIQVACAVKNYYTKFATFDNTLAKRYKKFINIELL